MKKEYTNPTIEVVEMEMDEIVMASFAGVKFRDLTDSENENHNDWNW